MVSSTSARRFSRIIAAEARRARPVRARAFRCAGFLDLMLRHGRLEVARAAHQVGHAGADADARATPRTGSRLELARRLLPSLSSRASCGALARSSGAEIERRAPLLRFGSLEIDRIRSVRADGRNAPSPAISSAPVALAETQPRALARNPHGSRQGEAAGSLRPLDRRDVSRIARRRERPQKPRRISPSAARAMCLQRRKDDAATDLRIYLASSESHRVRPAAGLLWHSFADQVPRAGARNPAHAGRNPPAGRCDPGRAPGGARAVAADCAPTSPSPPTARRRFGGKACGAPETARAAVGYAWGSRPVWAVRLPDGRGSRRACRAKEGSRATGIFLMLALLALAVWRRRLPGGAASDAAWSAAGGVESLGAGDLSARVRTEGRDEVGRLAESFNRAAARIEDLVGAHKRCSPTPRTSCARLLRASAWR